MNRVAPALFVLSLAPSALAQQKQGSGVLAFGTNSKAPIQIDADRLEAFSKELEAKGIKLTEKYHKDKSLNIASATIVDPYGTVLELTEGLR